MENYIDQIRKGIELLPLNYVFVAKDFTSNIDYETARKTLRRLDEREEIKKIARGYYYKPSYLPIINEYSRPDIESYAKAIVGSLTSLGLSNDHPAKSQSVYVGADT